MKNAIIYIMFIALGCCCIYIWANEGREAPRSPVKTITAEKRVIMSIREMQTFLNAQGHSRYYCGEVDGIPGPKLFKAIDNWVCDRQASKEFE